MRYKNVIDRRRLHLEGVEWRDLLTDFVLGQFSRDETSNLVVEQHGRTLVKLNEDGDLVRMEYGLSLIVQVIRQTRCICLTTIFIAIRRQQRMYEIVFPDSTPTTRSTDDFSDGELRQRLMTQWDQFSNVTNLVVEYPAYMARTWIYLLARVYPVARRCSST